MVLHQSRYKPKYFRMTFHQVKCYQNQIFNFNYVVETIASTYFFTNINFFFKLFILH